MIFYNKR